MKAEKMGHDRAIHYKEEFICCECKKTFNRKQNLERHMKFFHESSNDEKIKCSDCSMTFQNRFNLERHVKSKLCESGKSKYSCILCKTECCSKNSLRDHVKKHHLLKCEICGLSFSRNSALLTHRLGGVDLPCIDQYTL